MQTLRKSAAAQTRSTDRLDWLTASSSIAGMTVGVLVEKRYLAQRQPRGLVDALEARGRDVRVVDPGESTWVAGDDRWLQDLDIVVARGRSWDLLSLLAAAESYGLPSLNSRAAIGAVHNKAEMSVRLAAARVPMPHTYIGTSGQLAARVTREDYPLIVKPVFGDNARGLRIFRSAGELAAVPGSEVVIGQRFLTTDGFDIKLYAIGSDVWVVRKPSPLAAFPFAEPELLPVTREAREIAMRCGKIFGLQLYGVDCVATPGGLAVIEVNDYPNYSAVPEADDRLAFHVEYSLHRERRLAAS
jgi:ribosomal protein S6--L-glutamate ligase